MNTRRRTETANRSSESSGASDAAHWTIGNEDNCWAKTMSSNKVLLIEKPRKRRRDPSISSISAVAAANNNSSLMVTGGRYGIIKNNCVRQKSRFGKLSRQRQVTDQIDSDSRQVNSKSIEQEATTIAPVENRLQATTSAREPASSNRAMLDCSSSRLNALITTTATTVTVTIASLSRRKSCESIQAQAAGKEQQQHIDHYSEKQIILSNAKMPTAARQRSSDSSGGGSSPYSRRHLRTARKVSLQRTGHDWHSGRLDQSWERASWRRRTVNMCVCAI